MALTEQLRAVARFEYALVRSALTTVDRTILTPLSDRSPGVERVVTRARDAVADLSERLGGAGVATDESPRAAGGEAVDRLSEVVEQPVDAVRSEDETVTDETDTDDTATDEIATDETATDETATDETEAVETATDETATDETEADEPVEGSAVLTEPEVHEAEELAEEYLEAEADHLTGELAENEDLREVQARLRAKHTLQEQDEQHRS